MEHYYLLFRKLEKKNFLPGSTVRTKRIFDGLMNHMKEETAKKVIEILEESGTDREYREKMGAEFPGFRQ